MRLGVVAFIGEHGSDASHNREGGQEQPLEDERIVDVRRCGETGHRHAITVHGDMILGSPLAAVGRVRTGEIAPTLGPHRTAVEDQVWMATQHADQQSLYFCQQARPAPACQTAAQGRAADLIRGGPQAAPGRALAQKAPQGSQYPDRRRGRVAASTTTRALAGLDDRGDEIEEPEIQCCCPWLMLQTWALARQPPVRLTQPAVVVKTAS